VRKPPPTPPKEGESLTEYNFAKEIAYETSEKGESLIG